MKAITSNILAISLCASLASSAYAGEDKTSIQLIFDDSGVLLDPVNADKQKMVLLAHLKELGKQRKYRNAQIDIISTSRGKTVWSGVPKDLKGNNPKAKLAVDEVTTKPGHCNALTNAFEELHSNLDDLVWQGYTSASVIVFSSLIHTPQPCTSETTITLPQLPPSGSDINKYQTSSPIVQSIDFFWVAHEQRNVWKSHLESTYDWSIKEGVSLRFTDAQRTPPALLSNPILEVR